MAQPTVATLPDDARERAIQAGCLDPEARRIVATYARQRAVSSA